MEQKQQIRLLLDANEQTGIESRVSSIISELGTITDGGEFLDESANRFFLRKVIYPTIDYTEAKELLSRRLKILKNSLQDANIRLFFPGEKKKKVAILVSKETPCLDSLLYNQNTGHLDMEISCIVSNHEIARKKAETQNIPFYTINPTKENGRDEEKIKEITGNVDLVILARYMQIVSPDFINFYNGNVINIHHGLLPAFKGANPYKRAFNRGVTKIGATAHYATPEIDEGPIIYQAVRDVSTCKELEEFKSTGGNAEQEALVAGVRMHLEDRLIRYKFQDQEERYEKVAKFF